MAATDFKFLVALRKESVDRNSDRGIFADVVSVSLSARRAWIEIAVLELIPLTDPVALRKESVDRNYPPGPPSFLFGGRSPQGERG